MNVVWKLRLAAACALGPVPALHAANVEPDHFRGTVVSANGATLTLEPAAGPGATLTVSIPAAHGTPNRRQSGASSTDLIAIMAVSEDKDVAGTSITVETLNGTVMLSGFAKGEHEKAAAEKIARSVDGVKSVKNDMRVK